MPASALRSGGLIAKGVVVSRFERLGAGLVRDRKQNRRLTHAKKAHNAAGRYATRSFRHERRR
jgi:hypothetical protein